MRRQRVIAYMCPSEKELMFGAAIASASYSCFGFAAVTRLQFGSHFDVTVSS